MIENMKTIKVRVTFTEELLGTASANPELHADYIASKAKDAKKTAEELIRGMGIADPKEELTQ